MNNIANHPNQEAAQLRSMIRGMFQLSRRDEEEKKILKRLLRRCIHVIYIGGILCSLLLGSKLGYDSGIHEGYLRAKLQLYQAQYQHKQQKSGQS